MKALAAGFMACLTAVMLCGCITIQVQAPSSSASASESASSSSASSSSSSASSSSSSSSTSSSSGSSKSSSSSSASKSSSSSAKSSSSSSSTAKSSAGKTYTVGNKSVGYISVPTTWEDMSGELNPDMVSSYSMEYYANPDTKVVGKQASDPIYEESIQMSVEPASYVDVTNTHLQALRGPKSIYGNVSVEDEVKFLGHDACEITATHLDSSTVQKIIIFDANDDGHSSVLLACNCGWSVTSSIGYEVLDIAETWHR